MKILSLDVATNTGLALLKDDKISVVNINCKKPEDMVLWMDMTGILDRLDVVLIEEWKSYNAFMLNPKTTTQLIYRIGYTTIRLREMGLNVVQMHSGTVRKSVGIKGKNKEAKLKVNQQLRELTGLVLTDDITDALAMMMSYLEHDSLDCIENYEVERLKNMRL